LPAQFWAVLQEVAKRVTGRAVTFQLNSADAYVPWELARVANPIDPASPLFLGAQVAMGRWILGNRSIRLPPRHDRDVHTMAVMVGMYQPAIGGLRPLPQAVEEAKTLTETYAALPAIPLAATPADFRTLIDATITFKFEAIGGVECVHFAGHGEVDTGRPQDVAIYLSNGQVIAPVFFRSCDLGRNYAPFLFLNACMVGTAIEMLGDVDGFPGNCLAGGFCGLVAPLWAVNDGVAKSVAIDFYKMALSADSGHTSVADILRKLRAKYNRANPVSSYLAYVYYGNPYLSLTYAPRPGN
jgi:CHAT domain-containing protein